MPIMIDLYEKREVHPMTLVYLIREGRVLLLKRNADKAMVPGKWLGVGGKIELNEDLLASAARECEEESGVRPLDLTCRGTFTWVSEKPRVGVLYLFTATSWEGEVRTECSEGMLAWHPIEGITTLPDLANHQQYFLPFILDGTSTVYAGFAVYDHERIVHYVDSDAYLMGRMARSLFRLPQR